MSRKTYASLMILTVLCLSACTSGHDTLKAPCSFPLVGIDGSPCTPEWTNLAQF